jgi:hypothetical protein
MWSMSFWESLALLSLDWLDTNVSEKLLPEAEPATAL